MLYQLRYIPICVIFFRRIVERHPYTQCRNKTTRGGRGWIRTAVAEATDLQSAPVDRLGTLPFKHLFILNFNEKIMVSAERFELSTSRLSVVCSNQLNYADINNSQEDRVRTYDTEFLFLLYQLSYPCTNTTVLAIRTLNTLHIKPYNCESASCTVHTFCLAI